MPGPQPSPADQFENAAAGAGFAQRRFDGCGLGTPFPAMFLTPIVPATAEEPIIILRRTRPVVTNLFIDQLSLIGCQREPYFTKFDGTGDASSDCTPHDSKPGLFISRRALAPVLSRRRRNRTLARTG